MKKLVCPHCHSEVFARASVCPGCGAEIVRGATRQERVNAGCAFTFVGLVVGLSIMGASRNLPEPDSDAALFVVLGLLAFAVAASLAGQGFARLRHRSKVRFMRRYEHQ